MLVPLAVTVPWLAAEATATLVGPPPERLRVIGLAVLFAATVTLDAPATGGEPALTCTLKFWAPAYGPRPPLLSRALREKL